MNPSPATEPAQWVLGIEAATPAGGVALATVDGRIVAHICRERRGPLSASLLADLDHLFQDDGLARERVRAIGVSQGPGAFTGLRVGLSIAKTLAHGWHVPLFGFSTLELMARRWPIPGVLIVPLLDARRGEVYSGLYRTRPSARPEPLREDRVEPLDRLLARDWDDEPVVFVGSGATAGWEAIQARLGDRAVPAPEGLNNPSAEVSACATAEAWQAGESGIHPLSLGPRYLRPSDAEVRHAIHIEIPWSA